MNAEGGKHEDGSVSQIGSLLLDGSNDGWRGLIRLWLLGALLSPSVEATIYLVSPKANVFGLIVGGAVVLLFAGLVGSLGGMKLSLIFALPIEGVFRCSKGQAWDAAFVLVFLLSRAAGVLMLLKKFDA